MNQHGTPTTRRRLLDALARMAVLAPMAGSVPAFTALPAHSAPSPPPDTHATATLKIAARVSVTATPTRPDTSDTITATAHVAQIASNPFPATGTIIFFDGPTPLATRTLTTGSASWAPALALGTHHLTASYAGDAHYTPGRSPRLDLTITPAAALTSKPAPPRPTPGVGLAAPAVHGITAILISAAAAVTAGLLLLLIQWIHPRGRPRLPRKTLSPSSRSD
jgi:hypothetical protein